MNTDMAKPQETVRVGGMTKLERYGWVTDGKPGRFVMIAKSRLKIDHEYQRERIFESTVLKFARAWSWPACGCLLVSERAGEFYVFDGQHRLLAALRRSDIKDLPCMVFRLASTASEAKHFLNVQVARNAMRASDKFRAAVVIGEDAAAVRLNALLEQSGRTASASASASGKTVLCIRTLLDCLRKDQEALERLWPLFIDLAGGGPFPTQSVVAGLHYIESRVAADSSLVSARWRKRVLKIGHEALSEACHRASAFYAKGGARVWAIGCLSALNKNVKAEFHLKIEGLSA